MRSSIKQLIQSEGIRQSTLLAVGNVTATGFSAISLIILSRFLGPAAFGGFSVAFSLTQVIARIGDFGFNISLQRIVAKNNQTHPEVAAAAIQAIGRVKLGVSLGAIGLSLVLGPVLGRSIFHLNDPLLAILGVALASTVLLYEYLMAIAQATARFTLAIGMNAVQAITKCSLAIFSFLILSPDPRIAYAWYGLAPLTACLVGLSTMKQYFVKAVATATVWLEVVRVARFSAISVLAIAVADNLDVLMVNAWLTEYQTGLYAAAARIALMISLVGSSISVVLNTRVAKYHRKTDLLSYTKKATLMAILCLALIPVGFLIAKPLLLITAGSEFVAALPVMNYLMTSAFVMVAALPFTAIFYLVDYPEYFAVSGIIQSVLLIGCNVVLLPQFGILGAGMAKLIARAVVTGYTILIARKHVRQYD